MEYGGVFMSSLSTTSKITIFVPDSASLHTAVFPGHAQLRMFADVRSTVKLRSLDAILPLTKQWVKACM